MTLDGGPVGVDGPHDGPAWFREAVEQMRTTPGPPARLVARHGPPPWWLRPSGLRAVVTLVLEQSVSQASARVTGHRLAALVDPPRPEGVESTTLVDGSELANRLRRLDDQTLRACGLPRSKVRCLRQLADSPGLESWTDPHRLRTEILGTPGIGPWTVAMVDLQVIGRPDVWPTGDVVVRRVQADPDVFAVWRRWIEHGRGSAVLRMLWHARLTDSGSDLRPPIFGRLDHTAATRITAVWTG